VTGAGKRLGRAIAIALAKEGYDIVVHYHASAVGAKETSRAIARLGRQAHVVKADIARAANVRRMVASAMSRFGRIDLLVNSAAVFVRQNLERTTEKSWDATLNINLKGTFLVSQAVGPVMQRQGGGRIVNIASLGGLQAWKEHLPYSVSKAGVIMLTKILARELAPAVQVNAIAPGTIILRGEEDPSVSHVSRKTIPLQRYGKPSDITDLVVFLATKGSYITGQIIAVDGGRLISLT
jgi:NAD(P)-dependent dehydrogenase (short-subunit alcohol dehydrogenase family)